MPSSKSQENKSSEKKNIDWTKEPMSLDAWMYGLPAVLLIIFCLVPGVSRGIFAAWACKSYVFNSETGEEHTFLRDDAKVRCSDPDYKSSEHAAIVGQAAIFVVIWPLGSSFLFAYLLFPYDL